ncbi:hypothetical protein GCM10022214_78520 [Actinomadura miaoliensis]|uniref:Uncharacterized protein n=1 Tax=Actinomadura miaoliensis TaxID=430685 RepID=A0ABP7WZY3_9ACTN
MGAGFLIILVSCLACERCHGPPVRAPNAGDMQDAEAPAGQYEGGLVMGLVAGARLAWYAQWTGSQPAAVNAHR